MEENKHLENLIAMSHEIGSNNAYVQGGGGNTSVKISDNKMAIKASGVQLKDMNFDHGIAIVDFKKVNSYHQNPDLAEDTYGETIKQFALNSEGRPSIETGFHALLGRYVIHSHSVFFNVLLCATFFVLLVWFVFGFDQIIMSILFLSLGGLSIYAAITYTVGQSAYGYKAMGDLMVFLFFGLLSVFGTFFLFSKQIDYRLFFPAASIGLMSSAVLNLNNMRDLISDKESKKNIIDKIKNFFIYFSLILVKNITHNVEISNKGSHIDNNKGIFSLTPSTLKK